MDKCTESPGGWEVVLRFQVPEMLFTELIQGQPFCALVSVRGDDKRTYNYVSVGRLSKALFITKLGHNKITWERTQRTQQGFTLSASWPPPKYQMSGT